MSSVSRTLSADARFENRYLIGLVSWLTVTTRGMSDGSRTAL
jgi:hypothetical protein